MYSVFIDIKTFVKSHNHLYSNDSLKHVLNSFCLAGVRSFPNIDPIYLSDININHYFILRTVLCNKYFSRNI